MTDEARARRPWPPLARAFRALDLCFAAAPPRDQEPREDEAAKLSTGLTPRRR